MAIDKTVTWFETLNKTPKEILKIMRQTVNLAWTGYHICNKISVTTIIGY